MKITRIAAAVLFAATASLSAACADGSTDTDGYDNTTASLMGIEAPMYDGDFVIVDIKLVVTPPLTQDAVMPAISAAANSRATSGTDIDVRPETVMPAYNTAHPSAVDLQPPVMRPTTPWYVGTNPPADRPLPAFHTDLPSVDEVSAPEQDALTAFRAEQIAGLAAIRDLTPEQRAAMSEVKPFVPWHMVHAPVGMPNGDQSPDATNPMVTLDITSATETANFAVQVQPHNPSEEVSSLSNEPQAALLDPMAACRATGAPCVASYTLVIHQLDGGDLLADDAQLDIAASLVDIESALPAGYTLDIIATPSN